jgi:hypothetical protein
VISQFAIDQRSHNRDGLVIRALDGAKEVDAFIGRKVMDQWANMGSLNPDSRSLYRAEYNALGVRNLSAIGRIVAQKYERGRVHNRQHPYVEVLISDIVESGQVLDQTQLRRAPLPPTFERV